MLFSFGSLGTLLVFFVFLLFFHAEISFNFSGMQELFASPLLVRCFKFVLVVVVVLSHGLVVLLCLQVW